MPQLGTGIVPSGAVGTELTYVTRRSFVPKLIEQIYKSRPLINALLGSAQVGSGGVSSITVPVQGSALTAFEWSSYTGAFNAPTQTQGIYNAEFNYKLGIVPIPFLGMEGLLQMDHSIVPLIQARMNDAANVTREALSTALYQNSSTASQLLGLPAAIDDGTTVVTYGGISRTTYTWWKSKLKAHSPNVDPTRAQMLEEVNRVTAQTGEMPTMGIVGFGTFTKMATDFLGLERYNITPDGGFEIARSAFRAIDVAGVPIYADPDMPEGQLYLINCNYVNMNIHESASFAFTGFESLLTNNQIGYIGALVIVTELTNSKCKVNGKTTGLNSITL